MDRTRAAVRRDGPTTERPQMSGDRRTAVWTYRVEIQLGTTALQELCGCLPECGGEFVGRCAGSGANSRMWRRRFGCL